MAHALSFVQPSGTPHLGNYLGAWRRWADEQQAGDLFAAADLHAMTVEYDPHTLRERTLDVMAWLLACGLEPGTSTLFVQSHVHEHTELAWILGCVASYGELGRMTQFKEKGSSQEQVSAGLFTYPVLMAADILLYQAEQVPVGDDQRQHVELTRNVAQRFNQRFGETFTVPRATFPTAGARVMDLQHPEAKMSKSALSPQGTIDLADDEDATRKKIMRAVTDSGSEVRRAADKPAITNLIDLFAAATGAATDDVEQRFAGAGYGAFKGELAEAVNGCLRPARQRYAELRDDPAEIEKVLAAGADRAREQASATMRAVRERVGLLLP